MAMPICRRLERQAVRRPFSRAEASAGSSSAMRMARMAMTTSSSMSVKARWYAGASLIVLTLPRFHGYKSCMSYMVTWLHGCSVLRAFVTM